jgi:hypothetical protein
MFMRAPGDTASPTGKQPVEIYLEVEDVDALHNRLKTRGVAINDPLTLQWWDDRTFKVLDPNGYEIWQPGIVCGTARGRSTLVSVQSLVSPSWTAVRVLAAAQRTGTIGVRTHR